MKSLPSGKHEDGGGLRFVRRKDGTAAWVFRFTIHGGRREMGLGPYPDVSLKAAREMATEYRQQAKCGIDPIAKRAALKREAIRNLHMLQDIAQDCFEARKAGLKGDGTAGRWFSPLENHILPKLGKMPIAEVDQIAVRDVLAPIWHEKAETARKAANRLRLVLKHAAALGLNVDLQAVDKARALLGKQRHEARNIPALPWQEVPTFYASLGQGVTELALRLLILTGVRSAPIRHVRPDQIDLRARIWTIPAELVKSRKGATGDFRVPMTGEAVKVVEDALRHGGEVLFPGQRGKPISDMTMSKLMRDRGIAARPHGFRSSLRTWAEETGQPYEVAETALGHVVGNSVERAYQRSDLIEKRRVFMAAWADHVTGKGQAEVVPISGVQG
ncbi:tyrosine-type recombinase/integrase [Ruegeria conchae]|uniref:tyrosine-type recombinase/integrase n=1 Tax=Ruegeria conchae TaxID=981384 RepID=UPI0029C88C6B|nr:integrase arm-type DNA-binding domain-containing protein [Ruegeria conchae]